MKKIRISFDEDLLAAIDDFAASSRRTRSAVIREAVKSWLRKKQVQEFEDKWIKRLKENPQHDKEVQSWMKVQSWSGKPTVAI